MNPRLYELAEKYSVDKLYFHSYIPMYDEIFSKLQIPVANLLEIGIGYEHLMAPLVPKYIHGASLLMWEEFFPLASIYGCDIRPETLNVAHGGRVHTFLADQSTVAGLSQLRIKIAVSYMDIIIDDGSHETVDQVMTAMALAPLMMRGSVYIVEDVKEPEKVAHAIGGEIMRGTKRNDDCLVVKWI